MRAVALFVLALTALALGEEEGEARGAAPVVKTDVGEISGREETSTKGYKFFSYYSIPYAKPPLGELRFKDPLKMEPWEGVKDGTSRPPYCLQIPATSFFQGRMELDGLEDCLVLNVFTTKPNSHLARLPVMVYIHGGAFLFGGAEEFPPNVLLNHEIVLVVVQYRVGLLGFLSTEDEEAPGNLGLKDQVLALGWVQDHIHNFGGDATRVTLFGESAGAASAHQLMLSRKVLGLFHRVILQSGSALSPWAFGGAHLQVANYVGGMFNCSTDNGTAETVRCLQGIDSERLVSMQTHFFVWFIFPILFAPRVDGDFLAKEPAQLLKEGRHKKIDMMMGITADEGGMFSYPLFANEALRSALRFNFQEAAPISLEFTEGDVSPFNQTLRIFDYYLGGINFNEHDADNVTKMYGDRHFAVPQDLSAIYHARNNHGKKIFRYELKHRGQRSFGDLFGLTLGEKWVSHVDDLFYLFEGGPVFAPLENEDDLKLRDIITTLWVNFATGGDPTPDDSLGFKWDPIQDGKLRHLELSPTPSMADDTREEVREFWYSLPTKQNLIFHPEKVNNLVKTPIEEKKEEETKKKEGEGGEEGAEGEAKAEEGVKTEEKTEGEEKSEGDKKTGEETEKNKDEL